jgi:DNA-binding MarR family transcriptional regulator
VSEPSAMAIATAINTESPVPTSILAAGAQALSEGAGGKTLSEGELRAWRGLKRAHASLAKRVDAELERTHGLPLSSYEVLHHLVESPGGRMRMCDLAEQAQLSRSGLTRLADRLEKEGLLERCSCEHDARGAYACLTELGRQRLCAARGTHLAVVREQFLSRFTEDELGALAELWDRIAPCGGGCGVPRRSTVAP